MFCVHKTKLGNLDTGFSEGVNCHCTSAMLGLTSSQYQKCAPGVSVGVRWMGAGLAGLILNAKSRSLFS